ncbi:hypothetical protein BJ980_002250 [Nocardioides daedukensis]|uniref:Uncharacterized protein n=1 Tax=Nocardioides daedukensis TaxID=634462 RepID=A0A7Y9S2J6_9ACTN|nr:hypothetical protein [Nocardioides daedukensis]NYG59327.1 hypothetical protein [Nocardioides daedukensis]
MTDKDPVESALGARVGDDVADAVLTKVLRYSNLPNTVKGMSKSDPAPDVEAAALAIVDDPALAEELGLEPVADEGGLGPSEYLWGLLALAARADVGVLDRVEDRWGDQDYAHRLIATLRRTAARRAAAPPAAARPTPAAPDSPQKLSEVKAWLGAHADPDPAALAPYPGQKAAAKAAAVRALGTIGTPQALAVLGRYAADEYPDKVLEELHRAWGNFDRRDFAATMFGGSGHLDLHLAPTIEGIGAVAGLKSLDVILTDGADLSPLAECTDLYTLRVGAEGDPGLLGVEPLLGLPKLTELHLTRTTHNADLTPLARCGVRSLRLSLDGADGAFLLDMPRLQALDLSDEAARPETSDVLIALVRKGIRVVVHNHERDSFPRLLEATEDSSDVFGVTENGKIGFTNDESKLQDLQRKLFYNVLP